ncbi:MAG: hypothetical protein AMXMBFR84_17210 [Candidatus Hydrogenedentota bacterium]
MKRRIVVGMVSAVLAVLGYADEKVEVAIDLPDPVIGGTPLSYENENLEPPDFKLREPFMAPDGTALVSKGAPVTASTKPSFGTLEQITDGDKEAVNGNLVGLKKGPQWVQLDLGKTIEMYGILIWHFHEYERVYFDVVVQISDDPTFEKSVSTVYNSDNDNSAGLGEGKDKLYIEKFEGRLIKLDGTKGRYVRLYSNGNTTDDDNHYLEVEVYGKAP